jgi:hypothetical protein
MKHFGREVPVMLKSTPPNVPAAGVEELVPSFTTTENNRTSESIRRPWQPTFLLSNSDTTGINKVKKAPLQN